MPKDILLAAFSGNIEKVNALIEKGADVNVKNSRGWTPLHNAAYEGHTEIVNALIANGVDVNAKDSRGWTPLYCAACLRHAEIVNALIEKGADVNARDSEGETPLHQAALRGHTEIVNALKAAGGKSYCRQDSINMGGSVGVLTALTGSAIAIALFTTGTISFGMLPIVTAVAVVSLATFAAYKIGYQSAIPPSTKINETKPIEKATQQPELVA